MSARLVISILLGSVLWFPARHVSAEPERDPVAAETLFRRGVEALKAGDWEEACAKFESSMALDPAVATALKIARCRRHEARLADAWYAYQQALKLNRLLVQTEARRAELEQIARSELAELEPLVPRIRINVEQRVPDMELRRNGALLPIGALGEELFVDPGKHEIFLQAPGYVPERRIVELREGDTRELVFSLKSKIPDPVQTVKVSENKVMTSGFRHEPDFWNGQRIAGASVAGVGVASLAVAAVFGLRTLSKVDESDKYCNGGGCWDAQGVELREQASEAQTMGFVFLGAGVGALALGGVLFFTAKNGAEELRTTGVRIDPAQLRLVW